jgi:hypothetical protein
MIKVGGPNVPQCEPSPVLIEGSVMCVTSALPSGGR